MSFISKGISAIGKLTFVLLLLGVFVSGMVGVVYMALSGKEIKVPDITGKDFVESEKELASLGLKIKKRADRPSGEKINTVLEQLPRPGETVKTGQMILVVVSKAGVTEETPPSLKNNVDSDDTEKIEEMISDKPPKSKSNSNSNKKKADTTRDVISNTSTSNSLPADDQKKDAVDANKKDTQTGEEGKKATPDKLEKNGTSPGKAPTPPVQNKPGTQRQPKSEPRQRR